MVSLIVFFQLVPSNKTSNDLWNGDYVLYGSRSFHYQLPPLLQQQWDQTMRLDLQTQAQLCAICTTITHSSSVLWEEILWTDRKHELAALRSKGGLSKRSGNTQICCKLAVKYMIQALTPHLVWNGAQLENQHCNCIFWVGSTISHFCAYFIAEYPSICHMPLACHMAVLFFSCTKTTFVVAARKPISWVILQYKPKSWVTL